MEVEEVQSRCASVVHRSGQNMSAAQTTAAISSSITSFFNRAKTTWLLPASSTTTADTRRPTDGVCRRSGYNKRGVRWMPRVSVRAGTKVACYFLLTNLDTRSRPRRSSTPTPRGGPWTQTALFPVAMRRRLTLTLVASPAYLRCWKLRMMTRRGSGDDDDDSDIV